MTHVDIYLPCDLPNYSLNIDVRFLRTLKFKLLKPLPFMKIIHHLFAICFDTHFLVKSWWILCDHIVIFDHQLDDWLGKLFFKQRNFKSMNVVNVYKKEYVPRGTIICQMDYTHGRGLKLFICKSYPFDSIMMNIK